jgi:Peptidase family S41/Tricorn protease C1 domain
MKKLVENYLKAASFLCFFFVFSLSSCEKVLISDDPVNTPQNNFNVLWNTINEKYTFFDLKKINWDSVKRVWQPRVVDTTNDVQLFRVMDSMLYALKDGHTNLFGAFNFSRNWDWYLNYPDNFNANVLERNYLQGLQWYTGPLINRFLDSNRVGYVRYESFSSTISDFSIDVIVSRFQNTKGLIIDMRDNGGGNSSNVDKFVSRFIDKKTLVWKEAEKSGPGKNDFTSYIDYFIEPAGTRKYLKPVIILTNRRCFSATTLFVTAMRNLPNVRILGDFTGGGGGTPTSSQLPNGWIIRYSGTVTLAPDGLNIEGGIPPTIRLDIPKADENAGKDTYIDRAIQLLK